MRSQQPGSARPRRSTPRHGRGPRGSTSGLSWRAVACVIALLLAHAALADVRTFRFQHITGEHGLAQNTVSALLQDRDGYIWVGTQGGLHRYDGQGYKLFEQAADDPASLPDNFVTALAEGEPGTLWVGTNSAYVAELNLANGQFRRLLPADLDHPGEPGKRVLALHYESGHGLWVATEGGIDLIDPATGLRRSVLRQPTAASTRNSYGFASDPAGILWATLPSGLYRIDPVTLATKRVAELPGIADIVRDRQGRMWVSADGLYRLDPASGQLQRSQLQHDASPARSGVDTDSPQRLAVDDQDRLWIATLHNGLLRYDPQSGATTAIHANPAQVDSLPEDEVSALLVDRSGLLWVGTLTAGVVATDPHGARFTFISDSDPAHMQRYTNSVRSLYQSPDGALWIGTDGDGLKRYDFATDRFTSFTAQLRTAMPPQLAAQDIKVLAVRPAGDGALWVATGLGLYWLDPTHGSARAQPLLGDAVETQPTSVRSLANASDGGLWVGTQNHGLIKLDASGHRALQIDAGAKGLSNAMVNSLYEDARKGVLWIGTMDGLDRLQIGTGKLRHFLNDPHDPRTLSGNRVRAIVGARDGSLWVGTHSGLNHLSPTAGDGVMIERYPLGTDADHPGTIYGIIEDARGRLWLSGNDGLARLDPASGALRRFAPGDGLQNLEFNGGAYLQLADGKLAFGGIRGLNVFDPTAITNSLYAPTVVLTSARVGSDPLDRIQLMAPGDLQLRQSDSVLRLRFSALDYADPASLAYRYRLEGFDKGWIDADHRPDATYTNLDAGDYVFRAQATNRDGVWSRSELRMPVKVVPPWWNSWPARIVYALIAIALFAIGWRILQARRRRETVFNRAIEQREQQLKMALWGSGDDFWDMDLRTQTLRRSNASGVAQHREDVIGLDRWRNDIVHPDDLDEVEETMNRHLLGESDHYESEHRIRHPRTGEWINVLARGKVVERDPDGTPLRVAGTARDVSQRRSNERERLIASEVLRSMTEAVSVIDLDYHFVSINRAFTLTTGYSEEEIIGQPSTLLDSSQHAPEFYREMRETMELTGRWSGEMWQRRKDGEEFLCAIEAVEVLEPNGQRGHFVVVLNDITEKKRAEQELRYLANFDTLTGLPNRALLSERLARAIVRARRHDTMVAVLFLDLDRFKEINDSLGHAVGDRILKAVAARLQATTNPNDTVSRLGGDEFTVVIEDIASNEAAFQVARNILAAFTRPLLVDDRSEISITPSIGISIYPAHGLAPTDLLKHADTAMYQAKAIGRNTYLAYTEAMETLTRQRANVTAALRRAVDRNEFQLLYQPRLSLTRGRINGVEALLRWHSEELGEMMPTDFIPIAEETGMILRIGEWVLREACRTLAQWQHEGLADVAIAVNVSVLQLLRGNLPELIAEILAETGAPAARLELELTETMVMSNAAETRSILNQLRALGLSLAIDDFGTGYSSLVYLKQLPIDMLKIDKAFIADITRDPDDEAITTTIITMAHSLGLTVIAEGVESKEQLEFLREHDCDEIQGYWLSQPLSEPHCRSFITSWHQTRRNAADAPIAPAY